MKSCRIKLLYAVVSLYALRIDGSFKIIKIKVQYLRVGYVNTRKYFKI